MLQASKPNALLNANGQASERTVLAISAACLAAVLICVAFIDRPVADYAHAVTKLNEPFYKALTKIVDPVPPLAAMTAAGFGIAALFGVRPGPRGWTALRIALAILIAIAIKEQIKVFAGRSWPETWTNNNLSYIKDGAYGFEFMRGLGGRGCALFHSFPSGHLTVMSAASAGLALNFPVLKWLAPIPVALVAIGMIGADYHWVSDLIAGTALGSACAFGVHRLGQNLR